MTLGAIGPSGSYGRALLWRWIQTTTSAARTSHCRDNVFVVVRGRHGWSRWAGRESGSRGIATECPRGSRGEQLPHHISVLGEAGVPPGTVTRTVRPLLVDDSRLIPMGSWRQPSPSRAGGMSPPPAGYGGLQRAMPESQGAATLAGGGRRARSDSQAAHDGAAAVAGVLPERFPAHRGGRRRSPVAVAPRVADGRHAVASPASVAACAARADGRSSMVPVGMWWRSRLPFGACSSSDGRGDRRGRHQAAPATATACWWTVIHRRDGPRFRRKRWRVRRRRRSWSPRCRPRRFTAAWVRAAAFAVAAATAYAVRRHRPSLLEAARRGAGRDLEGRTSC